MNLGDSTRKYIVDDRIAPNIPQALDPAGFQDVPRATMGPHIVPGVGPVTELRMQPATAKPAMAQTREKYDLSKTHSPVDPAGVANSDLKITPGLVRHREIVSQILKTL